MTLRVTAVRGRTDSDGRIILGTLLLLGIGIAAAVVVALRPEPAGIGIALSLVLLALVLASAAFPPGSPSHDLGDPAFLAGSVLFLAFGLRSLSVIFNVLPDVGPGADLPAYRTFTPSDALAMCLAASGWLAFLLGYRVAPGSRVAARLPDLGLTRSGPGMLSLLSLILAGAGWTAKILVFAQRPLGFDPVAADALDSTQTLIVWLTGCTEVALALAFVRICYFARAASSVLWAGGLLSLEIGIGLLTGSRAQILNAILTPMAVLALSGRLHFSSRYLLLVPVAVASFGFTYVYRSVPAQVPSGVAGVADRLGLTVSIAAEMGPVGLTQAGLENISNRYAGLDSVRQILDVGVSDSPSWGARYVLAIPSAVIPRFLWPGKPYDTQSQDFARAYYGVPPDSNVSFTATWIGDLLLQGPIPFLYLGMALLGLLLRALRDYGRAHARTAHLSVVMYAVILPIVITSDSWIFSIVWQVTRVCVIVSLLAVCMILTSGRPRLWSESGQGAAGE